MNEDIVVPTLNEAPNDQLTDAVDKVEYVVMFALINPGFTSDLLEEDMPSISSIIAKKSLDSDAIVQECENTLGRQVALVAPDSNYSISVEIVADDEESATLKVSVLDEDGTLVINTDKHTISK